jgi:hypothetical protein
MVATDRDPVKTRQVRAHFVVSEFTWSHTAFTSSLTALI